MHRSFEPDRQLATWRPAQTAVVEHCAHLRGPIPLKLGSDSQEALMRTSERGRTGWRGARHVGQQTTCLASRRRRLPARIQPGPAVSGRSPAPATGDGAEHGGWAGLDWPSRVRHWLAPAPAQHPDSSSPRRPDGGRLEVGSTGLAEPAELDQKCRRSPRR